eukprot:271925_1
MFRRRLFANIRNYCVNTVKYSERANKQYFCTATKKLNYTQDDMRRIAVFGAGKLHQDKGFKPLYHSNQSEKPAAKAKHINKAVQFVEPNKQISVILHSAQSQCDNKCWKLFDDSHCIHVYETPIVSSVEERKQINQWITDEFGWAQIDDVKAFGIAIQKKMNKQFNGSWEIDVGRGADIDWNCYGVLWHNNMKLPFF